MGNRDALLSNPGDPRWRELEAHKRRLLGAAGSSVEERLTRGRRLSAQPAALRRAIADDRALGA